MLERIILYADEGKVLTDGTVYGKEILLSHSEDKNNFYEITDEEYEALHEVIEDDNNI